MGQLIRTWRLKSESLLEMALDLGLADVKSSLTPVLDQAELSTKSFCPLNILVHVETRLVYF